MLARRREAEAEVRRAKLEIEARNESLQLVNQLADRLHRTLDVDAIATEAVAALAGHGGAALAALYFLNDRGSELRLIAERGFTEEERRLAETLPVEESLTGAAVRERRILVAEDMRGDSGVRLGIASLLVSRGLVTAIAVPLLYGSEALGSINLAFRERRSFGPLDLETFQAIGRTVSLAITNARHVAGLEYQAFHDSLTALPNRWSLHRRLAALLGAQEGRIALMLMDLRRFREINEALGHNVGDELLQSVATRLALGREGERSEVFRLGGDEFAVLLQEVDDEGNAEARAQRLHDAMREPCSVGGISVELHTSVGVAVQSDGGDGRELLRRADVAVYRSKQTGVGVVPYSSELDRHTPERLALLADLARAIREGGLELHYQPKVSLRDGAIVGFEALVRWPHPKLGLLFPADFLPLAESTEVINPLTYWVVERALGQLRKWNEVYPELTMAINLSVRNLLDRNCSQRLEELMRNAGVDPARVEFELTETAVMTDPEAALTMLQRITSTGAHLAIDDFGTGFSSLVYLKRFPLHGIKIDRSFVVDMAKGEQSLAIVRSTVQLARSLGLSVVAEGIEDFQTASELREIGCDQAQGYFFASPAASSEIDSLLSTDERFPQYGHHRGSP
jgi:diguanylate cyclase (GGDEF)-like protein